MPGTSMNSPTGLEKDGFGENPLFQCAVAEDEHQYLVGYVIYFPIYIPRLGKSMYLQDLYVREQFRKLGIGRRLFTKVAQSALDSDCLRIDWRVLN
ncbi:diamine acetyltransferase 2-like [Ctenocephalides felis]|uniref:diamine acetyltransferase 2-like n=1 Tax=Ctenocephalides felis TaxID=7515 RepID=UPI000E6E5A4A|nr:diamine acetyltransferase 2-like [Ctenocephalides felis]